MCRYCVHVHQWIVSDSLTVFSILPMPSWGRLSWNWLNRSKAVCPFNFCLFFFFSFVYTTSPAAVMVVFFRSSKPPYNFWWSWVAEGHCAIRSGWCVLHIWRTCSVGWSSSPQGHVGEGTTFSFLCMCALILLCPERSRAKTTWLLF